MGYDESREGYERAHAQHREAHGPGGERKRPIVVTERYAALIYAGVDAAALIVACGTRTADFAQLGARVLALIEEQGESEMSRENAPGCCASVGWQALVAARSLNLLPEAKP